MSTSTLMLLRLVHVVIGIFWVGSVVFISAFLIPSIRSAGPGGGAVMTHLQQRKLSIVLMLAGILTVASGFVLYMQASAGSTAWFGSGPGRTFGLGAVFGIITLVIGMTVNAPTGVKLGRLGAAVQAAGGTPSAEQAAEMQRLQVRMGKASLAGAVLLTCAAAAMAVARYVP